MPANYVGNPGSVQSPDTGQAPNENPILSLPVDADALNSASIYQPLKKCADNLAWLNGIVGGTLTAKSLMVDAVGGTPSAGTPGTISASGSISSGGSISAAGAITGASLLTSGSIVSEAPVTKTIWIPWCNCLALLGSPWSIVSGFTGLQAGGASSFAYVPVALPTTGALPPAGSPPTLISVGFRCHPAVGSTIFGSVIVISNMLSSSSDPTAVASNGSSSGSTSQTFTVTVNTAMTQDKSVVLVIQSGASGDQFFGAFAGYSSVVF